jgi:type I restriction enzyme S subunit
MEAIIDYRGKTPRKTTFGIPLITAKVVKGGRIETPDEFIDPAEYDEWMRRGLPRKGDVLITTEAPLGEVAQLGGEKVALAQRLIALRGRQGKLDNTFLKFLLQSEFIQLQLAARASGSTVSGIKQSELRRIQLLLPPFAEQQAIACILGSLDDKIELNRRMNRTLEAMARAIFKSWFVDFDPVRAKAAGQPPPGLTPALAALFPDAFEDSELGEIPKGWKVGSILEFADLLSGGTPKTNEPSYWGGGIPWASAADVSQCGEAFLTSTERAITKEGLDNSATQVIPAMTTVVVARGATTGRMTMFGADIAMNQTCYALRTKRTTPRFLYLLLQDVMDSLVHAAHGSVFDTITTATFRSSRVLLPNSEIARAFERIVTGCFDQILCRLRESRTLAALRDTLLPKLISGELRVPDAERIVGRAT